MGPVRTGLVAVIAILLAASGVAVPAAADGGGIALQVSQDGLGGVYVSATYEEDGHPVDALIDPVLRASSPGSADVGPIELVSSGQGVGIWTTPGPVHTEGAWTITVATTVPIDATVTTELTIAVVDPPVEALADGIAEPGPEASGGEYILPLVIGFIVIVMSAVLIRRRWRKAARSPALG